MKESRILEYETPHFLYGLFADDLSLLKLLEARFNVSATTRDGWLKLEGKSDNLEQACAVLQQLEDSKRQGVAITEPLFRIALDGASNATAVKADSTTLSDVRSTSLAISSGRAPVSARTPGQVRYLQIMQTADVVFGIGPAGTGKTYLAMAKALALLKAGDVERLILTRPAVEAGEALGFLPGDLKEKIFPYLRPLYDALYDMLKPEEVERYIDRGMVEIAPLAYMRGRTLNRACVILDEAQNTTCEQMFMFLTRLGADSKCLVTGDVSQVDLKPNVRSGLNEAIENLRDIPGIAFQFFEASDVIRHPVVQRIIDAYRIKREKGKS